MLYRNLPNLLDRAPELPVRNAVMGHVPQDGSVIHPPLTRPVHSQQPIIIHRAPIPQIKQTQFCEDLGAGEHSWMVHRRKMAMEAARIVSCAAIPESRAFCLMKHQIAEYEVRFAAFKDFH